MITVHRLSTHLGAEITGVDLAQPLDAATFAQIAQAFFTHEVVCFRQ